MSLFYKRSAIDLGGMPQQHGHVVYPRAQFKLDQADAIPIVYKESKQGRAELSRFEVAFGELARLFLAPNLTPRQRLVKNDNNDILGVACEHMSHTIARNECLPNQFYKLITQDGQLHMSGLIVRDTSEISFYFLDELKPGFFNTLSCAAKNGLITLDMTSLASVLTSSYSLEEDDLHKGNVGFYIAQNQTETKPRVVFFKIDHDLMLADSVMSHCHSRFLNWLNGSDAFDITVRDLVNFPILTDSQNYYWPTVRRSMFGVGNKAYSSDEEVNAFAELATSEEFRRMKWLSFYKHVLIPPVFIQTSLSTHLDENDPDDRAQIALITQSVVARQAKLRAVLFSIPEFRKVVRLLGDQDHQSMVQSIMEGVGMIDNNEFEAKQMASTMAHHRELCKPGGGFVIGDTPLHVAIRLQDYRYQETWQAYGRFAEQTNKEGKTPLDVAVSMASASPRAPNDVRGDVLCTMKHMLREGVKKTEDYQQMTRGSPINLTNYLFHSSYPARAAQLENATQLKLFLRDLGEDHRYSLKMQKELSVVCVRKFIKTHQNNAQLGAMLYELKADLNGTSTSPPAPELQFIRQLRSQLWIVRIIRGLLGGTSTKVELNSIIDRELKRIEPPEPFCWLFFSKKQPQQQADIAEVIPKANVP